MNVLVVYCHPLDDSFCAALRDTVLDGLSKGSHNARLIDLYAEGFDPVLSPDERRIYNDADAILTHCETHLAAHIAALRWAEAVVFVYPTWWFSLPAMLKGWLDRVWLPEMAFRMPTETLPIRPALTNIRHLIVVTTLGSPYWFWQAVIGAPGRRVLLRGLRACVHPRCRTSWLALYRMDTRKPRDRTAFLHRVARKIEALPA